MGIFHGRETLRASYFIWIENQKKNIVAENLEIRYPKDAYNWTIARALDVEPKFQTIFRAIGNPWGNGFSVPRPFIPRVDALNHKIEWTKDESDIDKIFQKNAEIVQQVQIREEQTAVNMVIRDKKRVLRDKSNRTFTIDEVSKILEDVSKNKTGKIKVETLVEEIKKDLNEGVQKKIEKSLNLPHISNLEIGDKVRLNMKEVSRISRLMSERKLTNENISRSLYEITEIVSRNSIHFENKVKFILRQVFEKNFIDDWKKFVFTLKLDKYKNLYNNLKEILERKDFISNIASEVKIGTEDQIEKLKRRINRIFNAETKEKDEGVYFFCFVIFIFTSQMWSSGLNIWKKKKSEKIKSSVKSTNLSQSTEEMILLF